VYKRIVLQPYNFQPLGHVESKLTCHKNLLIKLAIFFGMIIFSHTTFSGFYLKVIIRKAPKPTPAIADIKKPFWGDWFAF